MKKLLKLAAYSAFALAYAGASHSQEIEMRPLLKQCADESLTKAVESGLTLGIIPAPPFSGIDPETGKAGGIDVEINEAVAKWLGVSVKYEQANFNQMVPMLTANRIDVIAVSLKATTDRQKIMAFSGPAWWYGPTLIIQSGNPKQIKGWTDIFSGSKKLAVGVMLGTGADTFLGMKNVEATRFQNYGEEFAALQQGRVDVLVEDNLTYEEFKKSNSQAPVEHIDASDVPGEFLHFGFGYARYGFRTEDCSLQAAWSQGLAEIRAAGVVSAILKKYELDDSALFNFPLQVK